MQLNKFSLIIITIALFAVTACSGQRHREAVENYIASVKSKPATQNLPPLPPIKRYSVPKYDVVNLRSPFRPNMVKITSATRQREPLEDFPLDSLRFVGVITDNNQKWALIAAPNNKLYRIANGQYLGQNSGRVAEIVSNYLDIVELVAEGNELIEHHIKMQLWTRSQKSVKTKSK